MSGHAALLELAVDGKEATRFFADGLVFATPTGSTAYSLSAGGPILMPQSPSLAIVPICPHALASRPLVVPDTSVFTVSLAARPGADMVQIYSDGSAVRQLKAGESVEIRKSDRSVKFVELGDYNPYRVLERKLGWTGGSFV